MMKITNILNKYKNLIKLKIYNPPHIIKIIDPKIYLNNNFILNNSDLDFELLRISKLLNKQLDMKDIILERQFQLYQDPFNKFFKSLGDSLF